LHPVRDLLVPCGTGLRRRRVSHSAQRTTRASAQVTLLATRCCRSGRCRCAGDDKLKPRISRAGWWRSAAIAACCRSIWGLSMQSLFSAERTRTRRELIAAMQSLDAARRALLRAERDGQVERATELHRDIVDLDANIRRLDARLAQLTTAPAIAGGRQN
jgi:hypothetical protein